jgi:hypothetical protein
LTKAPVNARANGSVAHASGNAPAFSAGVPTSSPAAEASATTGAANRRRSIAREQEAVVGDSLGVADAFPRDLPRVAPLFPLPAMVGSEHVDAGVIKHSSR